MLDTPRLSDGRFVLQSEVPSIPTINLKTRRQRMTEYELADLMGSVSGDSLVFIPLVISLVSGYLVVAWLIGSKLTKSQLYLINSLFLGMNLLLGSAWVTRVQVALSYQSELLELNPERAGLVGPWLIPAVFILAISGITACLKFMWDVRHPRT